MKRFTRLGFLLLITFWGCTNTSQVVSQKAANRLINESSPYLLQHAYNPVDWHPWGEEALQKAKDENKLLIVSIGYAACHWCHVMEHESFEDSTVARVMNEFFIPVKVDREERPDVDDVYMSAAQLVSGRGGWPLNAFALPDGSPVWAGTYFPKEQWLKILNQFVDLKQNNFERLERSARQLVMGIKSLDEIDPGEVRTYAKDDISKMAKTFVSQIDGIKGGRRGAPKFPMPNNYDYLLKYTVLYNDASAREALLTTLDNMANGGIYDHAGGGFARYSVDANWLVPHFEKMLYDNAQLLSLYSNAYRFTKNPLYKHVVQQTTEFLQRELMNGDGRFYSSLDADSEGEEGKFYVWKSEEIDEIFEDKGTRAIVKGYYNVSEEGNWEHGKNILHVSESSQNVAGQFSISEQELDHLIKEADARLLEARSTRIRPGLDDKILTSWNALIINGYVDAYKAFGEDQFLSTALKCAHELTKDQMQDDFRLLRNHKDGTSSINGFLDDYALTIQAFTNLYEVTFDESWVNMARDLMRYSIKHFFDEDSQMFFYTSDLDPPLVARKMELSDNVIPASNSVMARNLHRLGELFYDEDFLKKSDQMLSSMWTKIEVQNQPSFYSNWLQLQIDRVHPPFEIAIMGAAANERRNDMIQEYIPNAVFMGSTADSELPLLKYKYMEGKTMIYVCQNKTCKLPVDDVEEAWKLLE